MFPSLGLWRVWSGVCKAGGASGRWVLSLQPLSCVPRHTHVCCAEPSHCLSPIMSHRPCPQTLHALFSGGRCLGLCWKFGGDLQKGHVRHEVGLSPPVSHPTCLPLTRNLRTFLKPCPPHSRIDGSRDGAGSDLGRPGPLLVLGWQQVGRTGEDSHTPSPHPAPPSLLVTASLSLGAQLQPKCM